MPPPTTSSTTSSPVNGSVPAGLTGVVVVVVVVVATGTTAFVAVVGETLVGVLVSFREVDLVGVVGLFVTTVEHRELYC